MRTCIAGTRCVSAQTPIQTQHVATAYRTQHTAHGTRPPHTAHRRSTASSDLGPHEQRLGRVDEDPAEVAGQGLDHLIAGLEGFLVLLELGLHLAELELDAGPEDRRIDVEAA